MLTPAPLVDVGHATFPRDGRLYWVRWIDGVNALGLGTGTPTIQVHLAPLPEGADLSQLPHLVDAAQAATEGDLSCAVHVGALPGIGLGSVFLDGRCVGDLPMTSGVRMVFKAGFSRSLCEAGRDSPMPRPGWWIHPWLLVPRTRYRIDRRLSSWCEEFHDASSQLIIPSSEVFRAFCAPETVLANAVLSGPWLVVAPRVINAGWSEQEPGRWQVGLRRGLTGRSALPAAAYEWSEWGRTAASRMNAVLGGSGPSLRPLEAQIPYRFGSVEFVCDGVWLLDRPEARRFLALRVRSALFPGGFEGLPKAISYRLDNFNVERGTEGADLDLDPLRRKRLVPVVDEPTGGAPGTPTRDPDAGPLGAVTPALQPVEMIGAPEVSRLPLEAPGPDRRRPVVTSIEPVELGSFGAAGRGASGVASLAVGEDGARPDRVEAFQSVADVLDILERDQAIEGWSSIAVPDAPCEVIGGLVACRLPGYGDGRRSRWAHLPSGRRRTCMVAEIVCGGQMLHWLEIERRPVGSGSADAYRFLLVRFPAGRLQAVAERLLADIVRTGGIWPAAVEDSGLGGSGVKVFVERVRHAYAGGGKLDPASVARKITGFSTA